MTISYMRRLTVLLALGGASLLGAGGLANAQQEDDRSDRQMRREEAEQRRRNLDERRRGEDQRRQWERQRDDEQRRRDDQNRDWRNRDRDWQISGPGRDAWRRREQEMLRQRQDDFRRREAERDRWWRERERQLRNQRRNHYWNYHQSFCERLRRSHYPLQNFVYLDFGSPYYRYYRNNQYYQVNQYGANLLRRAVSSGYEEGFRAGQADREDGWYFDPENCDPFLDGTYGYDGYYVDISEYQYYFREGFRRGYEDGYYGRYQYGHYSNGKYAILESILNVILNLQRY